MELKDFDDAPELRMSDDNYEAMDFAVFPKVETPDEATLLAGKRFDDKVDMRGGFFYFPTVWLPETRTLVQGEYEPDEATGNQVRWYSAHVLPPESPLVAYLEEKLS